MALMSRPTSPLSLRAELRRSTKFVLRSGLLLLLILLLFAQDSSNVTVTTSVHVILVENSLCWSRRGEAGSELPLKDITDVFVGKQLNIWHQPATLQVQ